MEEVTDVFYGYFNHGASSNGFASGEAASKYSMRQAEASSSAFGMRRAEAADLAELKFAEPKPFGKTEFLAYFEENRRQNLCEGFELKFRAEFFIDEKGVPFDVKIESNCEAFQEEFIHWLNKSPKWTVKLNELIVIEYK